MCSMGQRCLKCRQEEEEDDLELVVLLWQRIKGVKHQGIQLDT